MGYGVGCFQMVTHARTDTSRPGLTFNLCFEDDLAKPSAKPSENPWCYEENGRLYSPFNVLIVIDRHVFLFCEWMTI